MTKSRIQFSVQAEAAGSSARACELITPRVRALTPMFMPVATLAVLRTQDTSDVEALGYPILLANTYHLLIRPGTEVFEKFGGIHKFMNWPNSVLTDSGGYQIFSLSKNVRITEDGALFKSYHDGRNFLLSPETSIGAQIKIGSDIMMVLDQCVPSMSDEPVCLAAADITARWAERSLAARGDAPGALFGIIQGACFTELRKMSSSQITSLPFDGFAIGGLAVGESEDRRRDITEFTASLMPRNYPRYLMGVGTPLDLLEAVHRGVDMFDCILPTALAQQGVAYTSTGRIELRRGVYKFDEKNLDAACSCPACTKYSRAYLHHLIKTGEYYGANLVGLHNLTFYRRLMDEMRMKILSGEFAAYYPAKRDMLSRDDGEYPAVPTKRKKRGEITSLGEYEIIRQPAGFHSVRHIPSGEIMHSVNEPVSEAVNLYVNQSRLAEQLALEGAGDLVIWDAGMGAATNAMSAIFECEKILRELSSGRGVKIISFEYDLDPLRLAVKNPSLFSHVRHAAPGEILKNGRWSSPDFPIEWILLEGDFSEKLEGAPAPDIIFYDLYSTITNASMWRVEHFRRIHSGCAGKQAVLLTYTVSTAVRAALLAAGFYVGYGAGTGPKSRTTIALSSLHGGIYDIKLLDREWLGTFSRSTARFSADSDSCEQVSIAALVDGHPQFG